MNEREKRNHLNQVFLDLSNELDVPPSKYKESSEHYNAVGAWLREDSELATCNPSIYPQGSFALGTAVRPLEGDEYDVDAVCELDLTIEDVTQKELKELVGRRLKHPSSRYKDKIDPKQGGRRCWTIKYAEDSQFHLDVLPSLPDDDWRQNDIGVDPQIAEYAIRITDKKTPEYEFGWPQDGNDPTRSNPKGYAAWFKNRMKVRLMAAKVALAAQVQKSVEQIEDFEVRTPLQRVIQILKRHRDVRYAGDDDKPISIIITTLAAQAYNNEADLYDAILEIVPKMRQYIELRGECLWVENPVNPDENFADKWEENPRKAQVFFEWLDAVEAEYLSLLTDEGFSRLEDYLTETFGERDGSAAYSKSAAQVSPSGVAASVSGAAVVISPRKSETPTHPKIELPSNPGKHWGE